MSAGPIERLKSRYDLRWLAAAVGCALAVLVLSHLPQDPTPLALRKGFFHIDKLEHLVAYGTIALLFTMSLRQPRSLAFLGAAFLAMAGLAAFDELTQPIFNRQAGLDDFVADAIGILMGVILALGASRLRKDSPKVRGHDAGGKIRLDGDSVESVAPSRRCSRC